MLTFQALANSRCFRHDCGTNISCRLHVLQADLFLKIYSSIWLSQNFLDYDFITVVLIFNTRCAVRLATETNLLYMCQENEVYLNEVRKLLVRLYRINQQTKVHRGGNINITSVTLLWWYIEIYVTIDVT
jgi:hypothetical protein